MHEKAKFGSKEFKTWEELPQDEKEKTGLYLSNGTQRLEKRGKNVDMGGVHRPEGVKAKSKALQKKKING